MPLAELAQAGALMALAVYLGALLGFAVAGAMLTSRVHAALGSAGLAADDGGIFQLLHGGQQPGALPGMASDSAAAAAAAAVQQGVSSGFQWM